MSLVTVGLPIYGLPGEVLAAALENLLAQDFPDLDICVFDVGCDPETKATAERYARKYRRIEHFRTGQDRIGYLGIDAVDAVLQRSASPFFLWAGHDDRHDPTFVSRCVELLDADPSAGLAYARTLQEAPGRVTELEHGIAVNHADPVARFIDVARRIRTHEAWYGVFRRSALGRVRALRRPLYHAHDTLLLAEIALHGSILQAPEILFRHGITRKIPVGSEERMAQQVWIHDRDRMSDGLTLPWVRLAHEHVRVLVRAGLERRRRDDGLRELVGVLLKKYTHVMLPEVERAVGLVMGDGIHRTWSGEQESVVGDLVDMIQAGAVRSRLDEAALFYPEHAGLRGATMHCRALSGEWSPTAVAPALSPT